jgi:hypothetical protein
MAKATITKVTAAITPSKDSDLINQSKSSFSIKSIFPIDWCYKNTVKEIATARFPKGTCSERLLTIDRKTAVL